MEKSIDIVFCFDTTGSMAQCLAEVRRDSGAAVRKLAASLPPGSRFGGMCNGDYCDIGSSYDVTWHELTSDIDSLVRWFQKTPATGGGDLPECYEKTYHEARSFAWRAGATKIFVAISDDVPHPVGYRYGTHVNRLDWRNELRVLAGDLGVTVFHVQALNRSHATAYYREAAAISGGYHLPLHQLAQVVDLILAICAQQAGEGRLAAFEEQLVRDGRMNRNMDNVVSILSGRKEPSARYSVYTGDLERVPEGRFQVLRVEEDAPIKAFVQANMLAFEAGRGFYEFTKAEEIQPHKEVVLLETATGDMWTGDAARAKLGLEMREHVRDTSRNVTLRPSAVPHGYVAFIQSTSYNRKLKRGTRFLYEVPTDR